MLKLRFMTQGLPVLAGAALLLLPARADAQANGYLPNGNYFPNGYMPYVGFGVTPCYDHTPMSGTDCWHWPNVHWPSRDFYFTYGAPQRTGYRVFYPSPDAAGRSITIQPRKQDRSAADSAARLDVLVPNAQAQVWLEGIKTVQEGNRRVFVSPALYAGQSYLYEVRASWVANGTSVTQTRQVAVVAGDRVVVDFTATDKTTVAARSNR